MTTATGIFDDKATKPNNEMLAMSLAKSNRLWKEIKKHFLAEYSKLIEMKVNN